MAESESQRKFTIGKIYVKDLSFEAPNSPFLFSDELKWEPETKINLNWTAAQVGESGFETVLTITVTATIGEKTAYLIEVQQAGLFQIEGYSDSERESILSGYCPNVLFPFARQLIADMIMHGGFPLLLLKPVDFDVLYAQNKNRSVTQDANTGESGEE